MAGTSPVMTRKAWMAGNKPGHDSSIHRRPAVEVRLDHQPRSASEPDAVDLQILHHPLHVIPGLRERNPLDPVDGIDGRIARIAVALEPFLHAALAGVVGGECQDVGAAIDLKKLTEL